DVSERLPVPGRLQHHPLDARGAVHIERLIWRAAGPAQPHADSFVTPLLDDQPAYHEPHESLAVSAFSRRCGRVRLTGIPHRRLRDCAGPAQFVTVGDGP